MYKQKLLIFIYSTIFLFFITVSSQIIVDPYGIFKVIHIDNINDKTYLNKSKGRIENSLHLKIHDYETIIMGTSRAQVGIDRSNINFEKTNVFNASLSGTYFQEISKVLPSILKQQKEMKHLIYGIDFYTFIYTNGKYKRFDESLFNNKNYVLPTLIKKLLSWDSVTDMIESIQLNIKHSKQKYWTYGQIHTEMIKRDHKRLFDNTVSEYFKTYSYYKESPYILDLFEKTMKEYAKQGIDISLFISPIHAHQMVIIESSGLLPSYYKWMKNITLIIHKINKEYQSNIRLFNFSGFNSITTEIIPSDAQIQMQYYNESSHYKSATGDLILNKIYNNSGLTDFGILLTPENIDKHILLIEKDRKKYYNTFPNEINEIKQQYIKYKESRK